MAHGSDGALSACCVSAGVHPHWRAVARTFAAGTGHQIVEVPLRDGVTDWASARRRPTPRPWSSAYPNYLGVLEDLRAGTAPRRRRTARSWSSRADPVAAGVLRSAGSWGADVVVGEGQAFGTPLSFGGPYLGLFACALDQVRRLPGPARRRDGRRRRAPRAT